MSPLAFVVAYFGVLSLLVGVFQFRRATPPQWLESVVFVQFGLLPVLSMAVRLGILGINQFAAMATATVLVLWCIALRDRNELSKRTLGAAPFLVGLTILFALGPIALTGESEAARNVASIIGWAALLPYCARGGLLIPSLRFGTTVFGAHLLTTLLFLPIAREYLTGASHLGGLVASSERLTGPLPHSNAMGSAAAVTLVSALVLLRSWQRALIVSTAGVVVVLSDQRGAILSAAVGAGVVWVSSPSRWKSERLFRLLGLLVIVPFGAVLFNANAFLGESVSRRRVSLDQREALWQFVWENFDRFMPFGVTPSSFFSSTRGLAFDGGFAHAHNTILTYFVMTGALGGIAMLVYTVGGLARALRLGKFGPSAVGITILVLGLTESPTFADSNWLLVPSVSYVILASLIPWSVSAYVSTKSATSRSEQHPARA